MFLSTQLGEHEALLDAEPSHLYGSMVSELQEVHEKRRGRLYFLKLWNAVAPTGNIYRHCALEAERLRHCEDVWAQLKTLAKDGNTDAIVESIKQAPCETLKRSSSVSPRHSEAGLVGFKPLEELVATETVRYGPLLLPADPDQMRWRLYVIAVTWLVFWLQVTAPVFILLNQLSMLPAHLHDWRHIQQAIRQPCMATAQDAFRTLMGASLLLLIMVILANYVQTESDGIQKARYLPLSRFWLFVGNTANIWSTCTTSLAAMVMFWNENTPKDMAMDALTILWFFTLDDFNSYSFNLIMQSDEDFQRNVSWLQALLSHCPVHLSDVCDDTGKMHWRYNSKGVPLKVGSEDVCTTRMRRQNFSSKSVDSSIRDIRVEIQRSADEVVHMPYPELNAVYYIWHLVRCFMCVLQFLVPVVWFLLNTDCATPS